MGFEARDMGAVEVDRGRGDRVLADHGAQQRGLADAVAPEHAGHLARFSRDRDAAQRLGCAIIEVDIFDVEHVSVPQEGEWGMASSEWLEDCFSIRYSLFAIRLAPQIH